MSRHRQAPPWCERDHCRSLGNQMSDEPEYDLSDEIEEERYERFISRCEDLDWQDENNERP